MESTPPLWPENPFSPVTPSLKPNGSGESKYLRQVIRFDTVSHLYTSTSNKEHNGFFNGSIENYSLYLAYLKNNHPPYLVLDTEGMVETNPKDLALRYLVDAAEFNNQTRGTLPKKTFGAIKGILERHGNRLPEEDKDLDLGVELLSSGIALSPVPKLKSLECLRQFDWPKFIQTLTEWEFSRDPRIVLAQKAHLLRGIEPRANPHMMMITNGGTGKSSFYKTTTGKVFDKVTRNSLLGYARGPDEIHKGTLDGRQLPVGIDQIESGEWGILDTVFNLMEYGEALISSGSVEIGIHCTAPIGLLGNVTNHRNPEKGMESILNHLTANPTIGRRMGILVYGEEYKAIKQRSSSQRWYEWEKNAQFYRAVEEAALPNLKRIYQQESVWSWLGKPIPGYSDAVDKITKSMDPGLVQRFCREHGHSGQSRVRSAALSVSIVEHMDLIALGEHSLEMILEHADDLLHEFAAINLESIRNLVKNARAEIAAGAEAYYRAQPRYVQLIIEAVEYARRSGITTGSFYLSGLQEEYKTNSDAYPWLSTCIQALNRKKRGKVRLNKRLREFFGFNFEPRDNDLEIVLDQDFYIDLAFLSEKVAPEPLETSKVTRITRPSRITSEISRPGESLENLETLESLEGLEDTREQEPNISPVSGLSKSGENSEESENGENLDQDEPDISPVSPPKKTQKPGKQPRIGYLDKMDHLLATIHAIDPEAWYKAKDLDPFIKLEPEEIQLLLQSTDAGPLFLDRPNGYKLTEFGQKAAAQAKKQEALQ